MTKSASKRLYTRKLLAFSLLLGVGVPGFMTSKLIKRAHPVRPEPAPDTWEDLSLESKDGIRLGGWWRDTGGSDPVLLVLHGNGSNRSNQLALMNSLTRQGFSVMGISMRCHGDSDGYINDFGRSARLDVVAALDWLEKKAPNRKKIILGRSLGAAAAIFAAPLKQPDAYILESPYSNLERACQNRLQLRLPPPLVAPALLSMRPWGRLILGQTPSTLSPLEACGAIEAPCLLIGTGGDRKATPEELSRFQERLKCRWVNLPDSTHSQGFVDHPQRYLAEVCRFISSL